MTHKTTRPETKKEARLRRRAQYDQSAFLEYMRWDDEDVQFLDNMDWDDVLRLPNIPIENMRGPR